jgi:predicted HAD superfamily Cof-like phosphohydrolase
MKKVLDSVAEFHDAFKQANGRWPQPLSEDNYKLRHELMREENEEYLEACKNNSLIEIADALGDQLYILCGTILKHGMQDVIQDVFDEIHRSNMSKLGPDGKPILREDGKILKGDGYFKPNLHQYINESNTKWKGHLR